MPFFFDRALDLDDFRNACECEEYPLLRTINRVLRKYPGPHNHCFVEKTYSKPTAEDTTKRPETPTPSTSPSRPVITRKPTTTTTLRPVVYEGEDFDEDEYPIQSEEDRSCQDGSKTFISHHEECSKYYICDHGSAIERE